jgi:hypothetical protein
MRRLTHFIVLAAFVFSLGGHWYLLQGLAWVNMVREYSQMVPFTQAVSMTLSGQYPCPICKAIAEKKNSEQGKLISLDKYDKKFCPPAAMAAVALPLPVLISYADSRASLRFRSETPPTPPPRSVLA